MNSVPLYTHQRPIILLGHFQPVYLSAFSGPIYSWDQFQHSVTYGPLLAFSACGRNSAYGYNRPVCGPLIRWAIFIALLNMAY